ncbi:MAG: U32 family peptidase [Candidatus Pacearchaeota archaeon]|nr:U32 family peptidase [Candidatus Pacearchaeota archaeon]
MKKYELLAPVGNFAMLTTAINARADAIYFGLKEFSMRANAKNFEIKDLEKINKLCGKKTKKYLTLNTIIYTQELKKLESLFKKIKGKVDAVICWDLSIINLCKKYKIPFHISTQASVSNIESAKFYKKLGAKRIVLARELDLKQIKEISKIINIECFIHGAMCVALSGRCFTSQFLFNRSANRGECIHPCRRSYKIIDKQEGYELNLENDKVMSAKDLCTLPFIEKLKKSGIISFKIEGRNRDPRYVDVVTRTYRKALDKKITKKELKELLEQLKTVYNREFSSGFYLGLPTKDDFARIEHSASKEKKHFAGKITHYYPKVGVATLKLVSNLEVGNKIVVIGKTTGVINSKIESIEIKNKKITKAKKREEVGIKLPRVRKNDEVYILIKNK